MEKTENVAVSWFGQARDGCAAFTVENFRNFSLITRALNRLTWIVKGCECLDRPGARLASLPT